MSDLIPPHGGLSEPVDRNVPAGETADFQAKAASLPHVPVSDADLSTLYRLGDGELVGTLEVSDIFPWDKDAYIQSVYATNRHDHPGGRMVEADPRTHLLGGTVRVLPQPKHPEYGKFILSPRETRALFRDKGWKRVVAFQTRNPLHRAHEYALVAGLERLTREG
jgi:ATP sulfurylase